MLQSTTAYNPAVNRGLTFPQEQTSISGESQELKKNIAALTQLYSQTLKENEQLRKLAERADAVAEKGAQDINAALVEKDKTIGQLQFQLGTLNSKQKETEKQLARVNEQLKTLQKKYSQMEERCRILNDALDRVNEISYSPWCSNNDRAATDAKKKLRYSVTPETLRHIRAAEEEDCNHVESLRSCVKDTKQKLRRNTL